MDNALECDDMLLQQNIFTCEILILYTSQLNHLESFDFCRGKKIMIQLKVSSIAGTWSSTAFLIPSSLLISIGSSLFSSIFISQASLPSWLEEEGDDIVPGLDNPDRKQLETKMGDFCVIRESKPPGGYIMNFYRPKYVACKKTESGEHTRCPRGRGCAK